MVRMVEAVIYKIAFSYWQYANMVVRLFVKMRVLGLRHALGGLLHLSEKGYTQRLYNNTTHCWTRPPPTPRHHQQVQLVVMADHTLLHTQLVTATPWWDTT